LLAVFNRGSSTLEALAVNNGRTSLVVLLLGDPHGLEGLEGRENGTTDPDGVLALSRSNHLDLSISRSKASELEVHTVSETGVHDGTTRENNVLVQILADINITLGDRVVGSLVDTIEVLADDRGVEENLRSTEAGRTDLDDGTIGKLEGLLLGLRADLLVHQLPVAVVSNTRVEDVQLVIEVLSDVAELLLDVTDDFTLSSGGERVTLLSKDLAEVVSDITTSKIETLNSVRKSVTLIDGDSVGDTITRVEDDTGGTAGSVEGKNGLNSNVGSRDLEDLEHNGDHLLTVGLGVEGSLSEENTRLARGDAESVVEGVVPDLLHIIPVGDDTVLNGVAEGEDTTLGLSLSTDVALLLAHTVHDLLLAGLGATNDGGEDSLGCVLTGDTGLAHTGTVVDNKGWGFVRHCYRSFYSMK